MKKVILCILIAVLLIPIPNAMKDGGSKSLKAITYEIISYHRIAGDEPGQYEVGTGIKILGFEIYKNTRIISE